MEAIREYLIGITAAAVICGIAVKLTGKGLPGSAVRLMAGVFMALTVVSPLVSIKLEGLTDFALDIQSDADAIVSQGESFSKEAVREIISEQAGAYILDKAESLGLHLTVEVAVSEDEYPVPCGVTLRGDISPYAKSVLSDYIEGNLGIPAEEQQWIS